MMFGLFTRRRNVANHRKPAFHRFRPTLEHLETRACPAAPVINSLSVAPLSGHFVSVQGSITDDHPTTVYMQFSGVISGTTYPDASGNFSLLARGDVPGVINAKGINDLNLWSNTLSATLVVPKPIVTLRVSQAGGHNALLTGSVTDLDAPSLTVNFSGAVTGSASVGADGAYSLVTADATLGRITAKTTNLWGVASDPVTGDLTNRAPVITSFSVIRRTAQMYELTGSVDDESPQGLKMVFSGLACVNGRSTWVQSDGTFSMTVMAAVGETGIVSANVTDWWGAAATTRQSLLG